MREAIQKFKEENNFDLAPFLSNKSGFNLITGFYCAFDSYDAEKSRIEKEYLAFFNGDGFNKITPEYTRVIHNLNWFLLLMTRLEQDCLKDLIEAEKNQINTYKINILDSINKSNQFKNVNNKNFKIYNSYFNRLETEFGFNIETYITFKEYMDNYDTINKLDENNFKQWLRIHYP